MKKLLVILSALLLLPACAAPAASQPQSVETTPPSEESSVQSVQVPSLPEQSTVPSVEVPSPAPEAEPANTLSGFETLTGQSFTLENLKITSVAVKTSPGNNEIKPQPGKQFVGMQFTIENMSDREIPISSLVNFHAAVDGTPAESVLIAPDVFGSRGLDTTLQAGESIEGMYVVEASPDAKRLDITFLPDPNGMEAASFFSDIPTE